ncbi:alkaline shock response membrane anchor protein AmaP [Nocardia sp. CDC159]|uniref:Alkaline shock response membrane anchor protein AmaP n=1 Tax=Nocardia pulmonis TaxID=2951408 RepID=A0A9X2E9Z1_9NOCA|nr:MULTISPECIES: alkaline shock response membrane anchor protein AmaP [Nocardia]MCM6776345.1 alkaline shock response membrane anchor protein AmaP [Nocardia pulmonis]MCM6788769.1 alkaline shock response membrane anchor protein AmaP [Nocardia sp. CDC159]
MSGSINRPARLNRGLLGLLGLLIAAAGAGAIAAHLGRLRWVDSGSSLVPGTAAPPHWVLYLAIVLAIVLGLASLRWLAAQVTRLPRPTRWQIGAPEPTGVTVVGSDTAATPLVADIESYADVRDVTARLTGSGRAPELHLVVTTEPDADLTEVRRRILGHAVPRLRQALEVEIIPVTMEMRLARK